MNSGSLKISISSWVYNLTIYFKCNLILLKCLNRFKSCCKVWFTYVGSLKGACR